MPDPLHPRHDRRARWLRGRPSPDTSTPRPRRRAAAALALVAAFGVVAAGCGESTESGEPTPGTVARQDVQVEADGPPQTGGQLIIGLSGETNSFSPSAGQWSSSS
jgi:hypothetical protein